MERIKQGGGGNICNIQYTACLFIELTAMGIKTFVYGNKSKDMEQELKEGQRTKKHVIFKALWAKDTLCYVIVSGEQQMLYSDTVETNRV